MFSPVLPFERIKGLAWIAVGEFVFIGGTILAAMIVHAFGLPGTVILPLHWGVIAAGIVLGPLGGAFAALSAVGLNVAFLGLPPAPLLAPIVLELLTYATLPGLLWKLVQRAPALGGASRGTRATVAAGILLFALVAGRLIFFAVLTRVGSAPGPTFGGLFLPGAVAGLLQVGLFTPLLMRRR